MILSAAGISTTAGPLTSVVMRGSSGVRVGVAGLGILLRRLRVVPLLTPAVIVPSRVRLQCAAVVRASSPGIAIVATPTGRRWWSARKPSGPGSRSTPGLRHHLATRVVARHEVRIEVSGERVRTVVTTVVRVLVIVAVAAVVHAATSTAAEGRSAERSAGMLGTVLDSLDVSVVERGRRELDTPKEHGLVGVLGLGNVVVDPGTSSVSATDRSTTVVRMGNERLTSGSDLRPATAYRIPRERTPGSCGGCTTRSARRSRPAPR